MLEVKMVLICERGNKSSYQLKLPHAFSTHSELEASRSVIPFYMNKLVFGRKIVNMSRKT